MSLGLTLTAAWPLGSLRAQVATNTPDYYAGANGSDLGTPSNWSLGTLPTISNDAVFLQTGTTVFDTLSANNLTVGSLDVVLTSATTGGVVAIQNQTESATNTTLTLGGVGNLGNSVSAGQPNDLLFVGAGSTLNLYGNNGGLAGSGVLGVSLGQNGFFNVNGTANIGAVISDGGSGYGFGKSGTGTLILSGANTYTGTTRIGRGQLTLNFADTSFTTAPTNDIISESSTLVFNGESTLNLTGNSSANNSQTFAGATLNGFGSVTLTAGNAATGVLLNLGAITRNQGGGINIANPTINTTVGATNGVTTSTQNNAAGILGGWATYTNTDFATNNGTNLVAYTGYTALTAAGGGTQTTTIFNGGGSITLTAPVTADALKLSTAGTLTLGANSVTLNGTAGGILATAAVTVDTSGGGVLSAGTGNELIIGGTATLTINGNNLIGANAGSLTKIGTNTLIVNGANTFTGGTQLNSGTLTLGNASALGTGPITFHGGSLSTNASLTISNPLITTAGTIGFTNPGSGLILSGALTGSGGLNVGTNGNVASAVNGDLSQFTGVLIVNTVNNGSNQTVGGTTAASQNLGQATLTLAGGTGSNRRFGTNGLLQVGALSSAVGAGTFIGGTVQAGALGTNTFFGGSGTGGNTTTLTKVGTGSLTFNSSVGFGGTLNLVANSGTLAIDESNLATPTGLATGTLALGGGTFSLLAKANTATTQARTATTVNAGASNVTVSQNGGSTDVQLTLGAITRNAGGTVNFSNPGGTLSATNGITTTTANNTAGILGGWATVGGTDWAVSGGSATAPITAYTGYTTLTAAGGGTQTTTNFIENSGGVTLTAPVTANSLKITDTSAGQSLNLGANSLTLNGAAGGLLYAGGTSNAYTINGTGVIGSGLTNEFIVRVVNGATLTINAPVVSTTGDAGSLTKSGGGNLFLTNTTTSYSGASYLNNGLANIAADASLGTGTVAFNGGTLQLAANYGTMLFANNRAIALGNKGGTIDTNGNSVTYGGVISGGVVATTAANTAGGFSLTKTGAGTLTLTGANTYGGATNITGGTLSISSLGNTTANGTTTASSLGGAPNTAPYIVLNGGTLQYTGAATSTDRQFTLGTSGGTLDASGTGALVWAGNTGSAGTAANNVALNGTGNHALTLTGSNTGANTFGMVLGNSDGYTSSLTKTGAGTWVLTGANTYGGPTTISAGTLRVNGSTAAGSAVTVAGGTALGGTGTVNGTVTVASGSTAATQGAINLVDGAIGTLTLTNTAGLSLGGTSGNVSLLNLEAGPSSSDLLTLGSNALTLNAGGARISITNAGVVSGRTYTLLTFGSGTGAGFATGTGTTVGGFTLTNPNVSFGVSGTLNVTSTGVQLVTSGASSPTTAYWSGARGVNWTDNNGTQGNFTTDSAGTTFVGAYPGPTTNVIYAADNATNLLTSNLGQSFEINSLTFRSTTGTVAIAGTGNALTVDGGGITLQSGNGGATLNMTTLTLGATQTWANASANSLTVNAAVTGTGALTISNTGTGATILAGANTYSGGMTLSAGLLQLSGTGTLGSTSGSLTVNGGTLDLNSTSQTVGNLTGTGGTILNNGATASTLTIGNGSSASGNFQGVIADNSNAGTGTLALTKAGSGTIQLSGTNTYSRATTINGGILQISSPANLGNASATNTLALNNGTLETLSGTYDLGATRTVTLTGSGGIQTDSGAVTISGAVTGGGTLTKAGAGALTLAATGNSYSGATTVNAGTLTLSGTYTGGAAFTVRSGATLNLNGASNGNVIAASASSVAAIANLNSTLTLANGNTITAGNTAGGIGIINIGTGAAISGGNSPIDAGVNGLGVINMTGGTVTPGQFLVVGSTTSGAAGVWNLSGGTVQTAGNNGGTVGATAGTTGVFNVTGTGKYISTDATASGVSGIYVGETGVGTLNVSGGGSLMLGGAATSVGLDIGRNNVATAAGVVNLGAIGAGGGTISTDAVRHSSTNATSSAIFNFHGGTLQAATGIANTGTGTTTGTAFMAGLTAAYVYGEGGTIDNNAQSITIAQALLAPTGSGVNSLALSGTTTGFTPGATPLVTISGGGGTGATAITNVDSSGNLTITLTNPGTGYTSAPTVTLIGGGATTVTPTLATNASGGLTFIGSGTTSLSGANTYTGTTAVNAGVLSLATGASLSGTGAVTIASGATFEVNGTVNTVATTAVTGTLRGNGGLLGAILLQSGGNITPGLTATGVNYATVSGTTLTPNLTATSLTRASGATSTYTLNLSGTATGLTNGTGNTIGQSSLLTLTGATGALTNLGGITLVVNDANASAITTNEVFKFIQYTTGAYDNSLFSNGTSVTGTSGRVYTINYAAGDPFVELIAAAVPEPSTWAALLTGITMLAFANRRDLCASGRKPSASKTWPRGTV